MHDQGKTDHYEVLQISPNADLETIHRVYRLLAQRFHPDNADTGNADRFRALCDAYRVLSDPETRATYDVAHHQQRNDRWRLVRAGASASSDVELEQALRLTLLEVLYTRRRTDPHRPGAYPAELEQLTGTPREHLEFTLWFLVQKKLVQRSDNSQIAITVEGVEYFEQHRPSPAQRRPLLQAADSRVA